MNFVSKKYENKKTRKDIYLSSITFVKNIC